MSVNSTLAVCDSETTGLDLERHEIWELALIIRYHANQLMDGEWRWLFPVDLRRADPAALRIGNYYERQAHDTTNGGVACMVERPPQAPFNNNDVALTIARLLDGATLVGSNPSFDSAFLAKLLRVYGQAPTWNYHLVDVQTMALGWLSAQTSTTEDAPPLDDDVVTTIPWKSYALSAACGVDPPGEDEQHTALGDARHVERWFDALSKGLAL